MGCACINTKKLKILSADGKVISNDKDNLNANKVNFIKIKKSNIMKINFLNKISKNLWLRIIDFLAFKDLTQIGKSNR